MPDIHLPKFGGKSKVKGDIDVDAPDVDVDLPKVEGDVDVKLPSADVDVSLPSGNVNVDAPDVDVDGPDADLKMKGKKKGGFGFNMPDIHLPKFGGKGKVKGDIDVDAPDVDVDLPKAEADIDVKLPSADVDVDLPSGDVDIDADIDGPDADLKMKGKKKGGFGFNMPDIHLPKFGGKGKVKGGIDIDAPDVNNQGVEMDLPQGEGNIDVNLPTPDFDPDTPQANLSIDAGSPKTKAKGGFKLPKVKFPSLSGRGKHTGRFFFFSKAPTALLIAFHNYLSKAFGSFTSN